MKFSPSIHQAVLAVAAIGLSATSASADTFMDQIGTPGNYSDLITMEPFGANQIFEPAFSTFNSAVIDDFGVSGPANVTLVEVVLELSSGDVTFGDITGWHVEFYSSVAAGAASLTGDIASVSLLPAAVTVTPIITGALGDSALISAPVNLNLPAAGTYYVALIPELNLGADSDQTFTVASGTFAGTPGGDNAFGINPGNGFGVGTSVADVDDAALRVIGTLLAVPEPSTYGAIAAVMGTVALAWRRRFQSR